jgi:hypothetical protein
MRGIIYLIIALALASGPAFAQAYAGAGTMTSGQGSQFAGVQSTAGPGGTQTFMLGSGMMFSVTQVNPDDASRLQSEGVRVVTMPAGSPVSVTAQTGQPIDIRSGQGQPNTIIFGPGGFVGVGVYAGPGTGAYAGTSGAGASAGAGAGGISVGTGTGGTMQMYSFSGTPGQAFLVTQQTDGKTDRVLVVFQ